ncbi:MAG: hydrogenase [Spirochaetes bacterium GWF1_41_5]|nr:MAG: hydrogenase [Spirochaetes bacterium GWF1_41_5]HBE01590.1 hydrogenase [Spirochaetia bacterium]
MNNTSRRDFIKIAASLTAGFGLANLPAEVMAALNKSGFDNAPVLLYLQAQSCSGCSISLLQSSNPSPHILITRYSKLAFHADLSAAAFSKAAEIIESYINGSAGDYILALEGSIPFNMPAACEINGKPISDLLLKASKTMKAAVAVGACATNGGVPGAEGNPTGAIPLLEFYKRNNVKPFLINIPGCPVHPDWVWQTVIHLVKAGAPELIDRDNEDNLINSPKMFFGKRLHENCPRYHDFQEKIFARKIGDEGCLFEVGCSGPITFSDCSTRWWNSGTTWCIDANAPCVGCASKKFAHYKSHSFYRITEKIKNERSNTKDN